MKKNLLSLIPAICLLCLICCSPKQSDQKSGIINALLRTVPSDAVGVMSFGEGYDSMMNVLDSTSAFTQIYYGSLTNSPMVLSLNYTGKLNELLAIDCGTSRPDTMLAVRCIQWDISGYGLKWSLVSYQQGRRYAMLLSPDAGVLHAAQRHLSQGTSILDANGCSEALQAAGGSADFLLFPNREVSKIPQVSKYAPFLKGLCSWTVAVPGKDSDFDIACLHGEDKTFYASLLDAQKTSDSHLAQVLDSTVNNVVSLQIRSIDDYIKAYREYLDAHTKLREYDAKAKQIEQWARTLGIRELAKISTGQGAFLAVRTAKPLGDKDICDNDAKGNLSELFGQAFSLKDESCCTCKGEWLLTGDAQILQNIEVKAGKALGGLAAKWPSEGVKAVVYTQEPEPVLLEVTADTRVKLIKKF